MSPASLESGPSGHPLGERHLALEEKRHELDERRFKLERDKFELENSFSKKWATSILGLAGVVVAAVLSFAASQIATKFKDAEDNRAEIQRDKVATREAEDRQIRLQLDYATFIMGHWTTFKGTEEDRQALITVTSLFPTFATNNMMNRLADLLSQPKSKGVQDALNQLQPVYDLSGEWRCTVKCQIPNGLTRIHQSKIELVLTNEVGTLATGIYKSPTQFVAIEWGALNAYVQQEGKRISWQNGSVWERKS
jgi:hypothetical protein